MFQKKIKHLIISSEKNEVPHYFFKKSAFFQRHSEALHSFSKEISKRDSKVFYFFWRNSKKNNLANVVATIKNKAPHYFFRRNEVPGSFIRKKSSASLVFPKKMKCLIISSEKNASSSFQKSVKCLIISSPKIKCLISFSDKIMRRFILFWRNNEVLDFFWWNHEALHFFWRNNEQLDCLLKK